MPLVSVIIPTRNRSALLVRAVKSVAMQTYNNWEIIIVDDASTDDTEKAVSGLLKGKIKYIRLNERAGGAAARNLGIKDAKGDYIAFLDDDDEWLPVKLEKQINQFSKDNSIAICYTGRNVKKEGKRFFGLSKKYSFHLPESKDHFKSIMTDNFVGPSSSVLIRRDVLEKSGGFDENLPCYQDYELFIRILRGGKAYGINEGLVNYYVGSPEHVSLTRENVIKGERYLAEKYGNEPLYPLLEKALRRINRMKMLKSFGYAKEVIKG